MEDSDLLKDRIKLLEQQLENVRKKSQMYSLPKTTPTFIPEPEPNLLVKKDQAKEISETELGQATAARPKLDLIQEIPDRNTEITINTSPSHLRSSQNYAAFSNNPPNFMPIYPVYYQAPESMLIKQQLDSFQSHMMAQTRQLENRHREELERLRRDFEEMIKRKDNEIKKLQRSDEGLGNQDLEDKLRQVTREKEMIENRNSFIEEQLVNLRRNHEQLKSVAENYKTNFEEQEKHFKNTMKDFEREARSWRDRIEEKSEEAKKEKDKSEHLQRKVDKLKDKLAQQDREIARLEERNARLEKDIEEFRIRSHENRALEDNESIKRQLNFMMQSIEKLQTGYARNGETKEIDDLRKQIQRTQLEIKHIKSNPNVEDLNVNKTSYTEPASPVPKQILEAYSAKRKAQLDLTRSLDGALNWENLEQPKTQDAHVVTFPSNESYERNKDSISRLENTLSGLQIEKQKIENELNKLPEQTRTLSLKKRRNELEMQLAMVDQNITNMKSKLRRFNA